MLLGGRDFDGYKAIFSVRAACAGNVMRLLNLYKSRVTWRRGNCGGVQILAVKLNAKDAVFYEG